MVDNRYHICYVANMASKKTTTSGLSDRHQRFCDEYLRDFNGARSARDAGFSKKAAREKATQLLDREDVQSYLAAKIQQTSDECDVDRAFVIKRLKLIGNRCLDLEEVRDAKGKVVDGMWTFDSTGANKSTELLGKSIGTFSEKLEIGLNLETATNYIQGALESILQAACKPCRKKIVEAMEEADRDE